MQECIMDETQEWRVFGANDSSNNTGVSRNRVGGVIDILNESSGLSVRQSG